MMSDPQGTILVLFLVFCRIGGCLMSMPGFSSARIPMQIRLFMAFAMSLAIMPLLWDVLYPYAKGDQITYVTLIFSESLTGVMFGLIAHVYVLGMQFAGTVVGMAISFNAPPTRDILEDTSENQLTGMLVMGGLLILFVLDFHHIIIKALADSYTSIPIGQLVNTQKMLISLTDTIAASMKIMLRLASPFLLFGLLFNVAIGLINKLAPQIPIYFISMPFALTGGLLLLYFGIAAMLRQFADAFIPIFATM